MTTPEETMADDEGNQGRLATYVVGIGASAGGLEALEKFFRNTPADTGLAFVIVQHLSPDFKSLMDELLTRYTRMPVHRVEDATPIEANAIYLIPPRKNLTVSGHKLMLTEQSTERGLNLPIDLFFQSLAREFGTLAIAVILSGTGSDGSRGIEDVKTAGGLVCVQSIEDAAFDGMPRNALATKIADVVDTAADIPSRIIEYVRSPSDFEASSIETDFSESGDLAEIMRLFRSRYGIDFTYYRAPTITRRLDRRITLTGRKTLTDYIALLREDDREIDALYRDLLVEVTRFFRDGDAWARLQRDVLKGVVQRCALHGEIRIWVPACATGEEAYSHAMLMAEAQRESEKSFDFKVFATDVHPASLEMASAGVFSEEAVSHVPAEFRSRYFRFAGGLYHITKEIRQRVIFAPHDLTRDPPFTKIDIVSCRNVLIYLEAAIQRKALALFHFGLKVDGILFLGPSESVGDLSREFETVDPHWRIFRKIRDVRLSEKGAFDSAAPITRAVPWRPSYVSTATRGDNSWLVPDVYESLLSRYVPPSLLVNEQHELVHSFGEARKLLVQPEGRPTMDVLRLVGGDLRTALAAALHRSRSRQEQVVFKGVRATFDGMDRILRVIVEPYNKGSEKLFLVCLEEMEPAVRIDPEAEDFDSSDENVSRVATLERELLYTKESLQATVEELETSNEELQATNEELVAANEELQSTNEELHSVNEELHTVNAEYQRKIDELTEVTDDMDNLLRSTEIGTIFLDRQLAIRKFTPSIADAFQVMPQDVGRPIEHIAFRFDDVHLLETVREVLESETGTERTVHGQDGTPYLERIRPYRTEDGRVDGVVLTFVNVREVHAAETARDQAEQRLLTITDNISVMVGYIDRDFRYQFTNRAYRERFGLKPEQIDNIHMSDLLGEEAYQRSRPHMLRGLAGERVTYTNHTRDAHGEEFWAYISITPDRQADGEVHGVFVSVVDITERRRAEEASARLGAIVTSADLAIIGTGLDGIVTSWNPAAEKLLGYSAEEMVGRNIRDAYPADAPNEFENILGRLKDGEAVMGYETTRIRKDGEAIQVQLSVSPVTDADGRLIGTSKIARRSSSRGTDLELLRQTVEAVPFPMLLVDGEGEIVVANAPAETSFDQDRDLLVGQSLETLLPGVLSSPDVLERLEGMQAPDVLADLESFAVRKDGSRRPVKATLTPVGLTAAGAYALVTIVDIDESA